MKGSLAAPALTRADYYGYGYQVPVETWPSGDPVAVSIALHLEEGAQRSPKYGDEIMEPENEAAYIVPRGASDLVAESFYEYGEHAGVRRLLSLLAAHGAPLTVIAAGRALEHNVGVARLLRDSDCEIVGQGMRYLSPEGFAVDDLRTDVRATVAVAASRTGKEVRGWYCRPPVPAHIHEIVAESGMLYDSCSVADDVPYYVPTRHGPLLVVPCSPEGDDIGYWRNRYFTSRDFADPIIHALTTLRSEASRGGARMFTLQLRPRISGRPGRLEGVRRVLEFLGTDPGFWLARRIDIAEHWVRTSPAGAVGDGGGSS